ncbi:hypothetical protein Tco_0442335 [Tanacetum coccineum]
MVPNYEKLMEAFIGGLPQSIEGNVTASKPQTLEEAINISQRLMDQIIKRDSVQETNDYIRKLEDKGNIINNNNYQNNYNNNNRNDDYHRQQNKRQETFKIYTGRHLANGNTGNRLCAKDAPTSHRYGYIKNRKKIVKIGRARTRESEEYKKKPKNQSLSQKNQASVKSVKEKSNNGQ